MQARKLSLLLFAALGVAAVTGIVRFMAHGPERVATASLQSALAGIDRLAAEFPAPGDAPLAFPADHATKPGQFVESWLFAGLVRDDTGEAWGFQLAFERVAVQEEAVSRESEWAVRDVWRARIAVERAGTSAAAGERISRAALGLAGASDAPAAAWVEDWRFELQEPGDRFRLQGAAGGATVDLYVRLPATTPVAFGREPYRGYWWPGLEVAGTLVLDGRESAVTGRAMLDRVWGRGLPVGRGQLALAGLWLEFADGAAYRCEQLRRRAGGGTPLTECSTVAPADPLMVAPRDDGWRVLDGVRYPLQWHVQRGAEVGTLGLRPLSASGAVWLDGTWVGIVVAADDREGWGLLRLSNFAPP